MIDFDILRLFNTDNKRLREIFTSQPDSGSGAPKGETKQEREARIERSNRNAENIRIKERFTRRIQSRLEEGIERSLKNWRMYAAVDTAWDSNVITKATLPLQLFAQGKINIETVRNELSALPNSSQYISEVEVVDENGKKTKKQEVNVPKFIDTNINIIRSFISRRTSAQTNKHNNLWPFYSLEPRGTSMEEKCRADVISQVIDIMVDQYGHRNHDGQCIRDALLYARVIDFVRSGWELEKQYRKKDLLRPATSDNVEEVITKQGVAFINPVPSRVFYDTAYPISSINTDTGCEYIGFWDAVRWSSIDNDSAYFNKEVLGFSSKFWGPGGLYSKYSDYFSHYQYTLVPPRAGEGDPSAQNDRKSALGLYSGIKEDCSVIVANYYEKLVPKDNGIGDYPFPVWVRFVAAEDGTVIFAEIMPSTPAAYLGINESDNRAVNVSMAMELFSAQDQMTNLVTHMLLLCQMEVFKVIGLNSDILDKATLAAARQQLKGNNWYGEPLILEYSLAKLQELGIKAENVVSISEIKQGQSIETIFKAMIRLVELTEKLMAMSPNEQGQPAPREISATEVTEIANTTSSVYSSISDCIDEFKAAKKRILHESTVACYKGNITAPVKNRYTRKTIEKAGFSTVGPDSATNESGARRHTVTGSPKALVYEHCYTTRDGSERPVNTQAANTLVQLVGLILSSQPIAQALGREKLYNLFNDIFRMSGAGVDLLLEVQDGEDDTLGEDEIAAMKQQFDQIGQYMQQMAGQIQKSSQDIAAQDAVNQQQEQAIQGLSQLAAMVKKAVEDIEAIKQAPERVAQKIVETLSYKEAPEDVKRQIEAEAGLTPSLLPPAVKQ